MGASIEGPNPTESGGAGEFAGAKVNLALHVLGQRSDGRHDLDSLVVFADLGDRIRVARAAEPGVSISIDGPFASDLALLSDPDDNLAVRAARTIANMQWRTPPGIHLSLGKYLPVAAGLGGGSADAAATLRLLNRYWQLKVEESKLMAVARTLGADVPMCLGARAVRAGGIGDRLEPANLPAVPLVLVNPGVALPTESVFQTYQPGNRSPLPDLPERFRSVFELVIWLRGTRNDLFEASRGLAPGVNRAAQVLRSDPDCLMAGMSGSGPTCYGIFASIDAACRAAERIRIGRPNWWVVPTMANGH